MYFRLSVIKLLRVVFLIAVSITLSCKRNDKYIKSEFSPEQEKIKTEKQINKLILRFNFPDTVLINKEY
ncbi:MAG: hypothetical protein AAF688_13545, partial [Bacteroidota bacterium]